jgi:hypothetical protein
MCSVIQILESCSNPEKLQLLQFCKVRHTADSKKVQLLELFIRKPGLSDNEYSSYIYGELDSSAYPQLKKRVKEELEVLILLLKNKAQSEEIHKRIECSSLLLQSQILLGRGLILEGSKILEKSLKKAIAGDFADLTLSIFDISQRFKLEDVLSKKDLPELEQVIKSHLQILVNQHYTQDRIQVNHEKNTYLSQILQQLNLDRKNWCLLANIRQSIREHNYEQASYLIEDSEFNFSKADGQKEVFEKFFAAKLQVLLQTGKYKEVLQNCKKLNSKYCLSPANQIELAQQEWIALFHLNRFEEALGVLKKQLLKLCPEQSGKWKYWEALLLFKQRVLKKALLLVHECQSDLKNLPNYYLGSKMLELMILFDQHDEDWLDYKIENLRKLVFRWRGRINVRIEVAFSLFHDLQRHLPYESKENLLQNPKFHLLQDGKENYSWNPSGYELVRYDQWLFEKIKLPAFSRG